MGRIKFVEWLDIDSGMLKLTEEIMNHSLGVIRHAMLISPFKLSTFPLMLGQSVSQAKIIKSVTL